jgi:hypothetical protein
MKDEERQISLEHLQTGLLSTPASSGAEKQGRKKITPRFISSFILHPSSFLWAP